MVKKNPFPEIRLKTAMLVPLALSLAALFAAFAFAFLHQEKEFTEDYVGGTLLSFPRVYAAAVKADTGKLSAALELIVQDEGFRRAMVANDRNVLLQRSAPVFEKLRKEYGITHFYFHGPDRVNFLRVHQPNRYGDQINRLTAINAEATGKPAAGLELGPLGAFTLRVVFPWHEGRRLIGYVELGEEIEHIFEQIKASAGVDLYVTIDKRYLTQKDWLTGMKMLGRQGEWSLLPGSVVTFQTSHAVSTPILELLAQDSSHAHAMSKIAYDGRIFQALSAPLSDAGGREVGHVLLVRDTTNSVTNSQRHTWIVGGLGLVMGGTLLGFFSFLTGRVERRIESSGEALTESEERFRSLVESSSDWIWEIDAEGRYVYASPKIKDLLGYEPEEILGKTPFDLMPSDEAKRLAPGFATIVAGRRQFTALENLNMHKDGRVVVLETSGVPILNEDGTLRGYRGIDRDITKRKRAEEALNKSAQRLALHFQQTPLAVIEWDADFKVVAWNPAAKGVFGYAEAEALGHSAMELILPESAKDHVAEIWHALLTRQGGFRSTNENLTKDGKIIYCEWYNTPLIDGNGQVIGVASLAQDVTEQKKAEQQLRYLAYFDDLTGLPNRTLFNDRLCQAMAAADRHQQLVAVMFMDLDNFKMVNDTLGHEAGNLLLQAVAARLKSSFRDGDTVARLGGDDFAVVLADLSNADDAAQVAQKILAGLKAPFSISGSELFATLSIGITLYPFDGGSIPNLLRNADSAMYHAKELGRNNFQFYSAEMTARVEKRMVLETGLRHALECGQFLLHYQPQLDISTGKIIGMEALIRWQHPEKGMVSPAEFIPVAEETGLIMPIGEWVLRTACAQAKAWQDQGLPDLVIAVNLSSRQFKQGDLSRLVRGILEETGLDPQHLELEITESLLIDGADTVILSILQELKRMGVTLAVDDFGTGYSSLSYLKRFPIDKLKIDQSFVRGITSDPDDASLVKAIIAIARSLRLTVIAEGVETEGHLNYLRRHDCDHMQGYYFSRPLPAGEFAALVGSGKALTPAEDEAGAPPTLLLVDDEPDVIHALERLLCHDGYRILTAGSAAEGLELLALNEVQVIVSDQLMPQMSGTEFLSKAKELYPDTIRMVLSGYSSFESIMEAINNGAIFRFLLKPWDNGSLRTHIREAFRVARKNKED